MGGGGLAELVVCLGNALRMWYVDRGMPIMIGTLTEPGGSTHLVPFYAADGGGGTEDRVQAVAHRLSTTSYGSDIWKGCR